AGGLASGEYDVVAGGHASTFTLTVTGTAFSGSSTWNCCPGKRTDPLTQGRIDGGKITFTRDCSGQGADGACVQSYTGSFRDDGASGEWSGTGGGGTWTMRVHCPRG